MAANRYYVVMNANSGTVQATGLTPAALEELFRRAGIEAVVDADMEVPFQERIAKALESDAQTVVAAGGDGTVTALAEAIVAAGSHKVLAILPLGTANLLARDLNIPLDIEEWIDVLGTMRPHRIDVGMVNGKIFLHKVVIGLLPALAAGREQIRSKDGIGAKLGFLRYMARRVARNRRLALEITPEGGPPHIERVSALAVASNEYDEGFGQFFSRSKLDRGRLSLYRLRHLTMVDMVRLTAGMIVGRWREYEALEVEHLKAVTIRSRKPRLQVMLDGEVESMEVPLEFSILPRALPILSRVLRDYAAEDDTDPTEPVEEFNP